MIGNNILRILPPSVNKDLEFDEDNPVYEVSWPHLQVF